MEFSLISSDFLGWILVLFLIQVKRDPEHQNFLLTKWIIPCIIYLSIVWPSGHPINLASIYSVMGETWAALMIAPFQLRTVKYWFIYGMVKQNVFVTLMFFQWNMVTARGGVDEI